MLEDRTVPTAIAAPGSLVSWWTANGTANDFMGLNKATPYGLTYATGEVGKAFSFDGADDRVQIMDNATLPFTTSFAIEGWVLVRGFPTGTKGDDHGEILFRGDDRGGLDPYSLSVEPNGTVNFQVTDAANASASLAAPIATGQFIHVAAEASGRRSAAAGNASLASRDAVVGLLIREQLQGPIEASLELMTGGLPTLPPDSPTTTGDRALTLPGAWSRQESMDSFVPPPPVLVLCNDPTYTATKSPCTPLLRSPWGAVPEAAFLPVVLACWIMLQSRKKGRHLRSASDSSCPQPVKDAQADG
jgi:hypothetical protein